MSNTDERKGTRALCDFQRKISEGNTIQYCSYHTPPQIVVDESSRTFMHITPSLPCRDIFHHSGPNQKYNKGTKLSQSRISAQEPLQNGDVALA